MAAAVGYLPISDAEAFTLLDERKLINQEITSLQKQRGKFGEETEASIEKDREQLSILFARRDALDVILCKAGRDSDPRETYPSSCIIFTSKIMELAGGRCVPIDEAYALGQGGGIRGQPAGRRDSYVEHVWVWPEGHPFIVKYEPLPFEPFDFASWK